MELTLNLLFVLWADSNLGEQAILQDKNKAPKGLFSLNENNQKQKLRISKSF